MPGQSRHKSAKHRLGEAGLVSLMRDRRYFDGNAPGHDAMVDLVHRGFQFVFDEPEDVRDGSMGRRSMQGRRRRFSDALRRSGADEAGVDNLPGKEREAVGRRAILSALAADGASFPDGFEREIGRREQEHNPNQAPRSDTDEGPGCAQICATLREVKGELDEVVKIKQAIEAEIARKKAEIEEVENASPGKTLPGQSEEEARRQQPEAVIPGDPTQGRKGRRKLPRGWSTIPQLLRETVKRGEFEGGRENLLKRLKEELAALERELKPVQKAYDRKRKSHQQASERVRARGCRCLTY